MTRATVPLYWVQGPKFGDEPLNAARYGVRWVNGYAGPFTKDEAHKIAGRAQKCFVITDEEYRSRFPGASEEARERIKELESQLETLQASDSAVEGPIVFTKDDHDYVMAFKKAANPAKKGAARKNLMDRMGFNQGAFDEYKDAWNHFQQYVLPYFVEE